VPHPLARTVRDYGDVEALLLSRVRDDPRPYAERTNLAGIAVRALLAREGVDPGSLHALHVAGSKGKGSTALMTEALLRDAGVRTGTYTSPHLRRWNERVRVDGAPVSDAVLAAALERLRPHVAALDALGDDAAPTFFDLVTAAGLLIMAGSGCEAAVVETGLGGRYDATRVVRPAACCVTSIELEHTDKLGATLADVAWHKAGIIAPGAPVVVGELPPEADAVIARCAAEVGARLLRAGREWTLRSSATPRGQRVRIQWSWEGGERTDEVELPHAGRHMALNAALSLMLARAAGHDCRARALDGCVLPGRAQVLARAPWIVVDAAHTAASFAALAQTLAGIPATRRSFVVSATRGKPPQALARLLHGAARVFVTRADRLRSAPAAELAAALAALDGTLPVTAVDDPREALDTARAALAPGDLLCACGSTYLAGLALERLDPDAAAGAIGSGPEKR